MSDYFDFPPEGYSDEGEDNPFLGLDGWDKTAQGIDPFQEVERDVLDSFGIDSFDSIFLDLRNVSPENLRGNRFSSITEAITYLYDAGILQFSGVTVDAEEIGVAVECETCLEQNAA